MTPTVALHGFTQTALMFRDVSGLGPVRAIDLPGHGGGGPPADLDVAVDRVVGALRGPGPLLGYSMGGRIALHVALARPDLVTRLVLVSASPGIADPDARAQRRAADDDLAASIDQVGLEAFVDAWLARPMFSGMAARGRAWQEADRRDRLRNDPAGLAAALRGLGQGALPWVGSRLAELEIPVLVVAGERDERYVAVGEQMAREAPLGELAMIAGAGHAVIAERPDTFTRAVASFLAEG